MTLPQWIDKLKPFPAISIHIIKTRQCLGCLLFTKSISTIKSQYFNIEAVQMILLISDKTDRPQAWITSLQQYWFKSFTKYHSRFCCPLWIILCASWLPIPLSHIGSQVNGRQSQSYKLKQIAKISCDTPSEVAWLDVQIWNGSNEYSWRYRVNMILSTDGQMDRQTQTDTVIPVYPPFNFVEARGIKLHLKLSPINEISNI